MLRSWSDFGLLRAPDPVQAPSVLVVFRIFSLKFVLENASKQAPNIGSFISLDLSNIAFFYLFWVKPETNPELESPSNFGSGYNPKRPAPTGSSSATLVLSL